MIKQNAMKEIDWLSFPVRVVGDKYYINHNL